MFICIRLKTVDTAQAFEQFLERLCFCSLCSLHVHVATQFFQDCHYMHSFFSHFCPKPNSVWSIHTEPLLDLKASPPFQQVYSVSGLQQVFFNKPRSDGKSQAERCSAAREVAKTGRHLTERKKRSTPRGYREKELILDWRRGFTQIH